jgi:predicted TIM-barrel fold metal-dependent hydrolase
MARKGCRAVSFSENPEKLGLPSLHSPHWDPFWAACCDEGTIVCLHIGSGQGMAFTSMDAPVNVMITVQPIAIVACAADLVWSRVLREFPAIRFALSEGGIGWVPYFLERADYVYRHHAAWTRPDLGGRLPSEIFRQHIVTCFISDEVGVRLRHEIGIETITWECDYPHSDTTWPNAPEILSRSLTGVPEEDVRRITHENAMLHFRFDPFVHRPRHACTVAALRREATEVDLSLRSHGGKPPTQRPSGPVTTREVTEQLMSAFRSPVG